ncbi:hypothetical protein K501DRAFT_338360 [Backusella circina FSU 941]|nr:hypothetical protein K501DRAFT_338360 [Backusella circina FSU 941]
MSQSPSGTPARRGPPRRRRKRLTPKQKLVKESAQQRFKTEKLVFIWQEKLFSSETVPIATLRSASLYLQPKTYSEVMEERNVQEWCGYPVCPERPRRSMQRFKISLKQRKVFDQSEMSHFCSDACYYKSKYYSMQLSEEPVWFRDLNALPDVHIITLDQDFKAAVNEIKEKRQQQKSSVEMRQEYVQQLLANVSKDAKSQYEIIEKATVEPTTQPMIQEGVYDSIEGYRIEVKTGPDGKTPSTMILRKKKKEDEALEKKKKEAEKEEEDNPEDPDALFETMMMLKDMNMDKEEEQPATTQKEEAGQPTTLQKEKAKQPITIQKQVEPLKPSSSKHVRFEEDDTKKVDSSDKQEKASTHSILKKQVGESKQDLVQAKPSQQPQQKKKKKKNVPELSLFGTIWTMLDHMTTKATRSYLSALQQQNSQDIDLDKVLMENESIMMDEGAYVRGQIFSEKILETYSMIRSQLQLDVNMENDMMSVIKTFRFSDASMVTLNPAQCYMMTLVFIKALVGEPMQGDKDWLLQFEDCCKTVDQSSDMVDACVRVLKVASV